MIDTAAKPIADQITISELPVTGPALFVVVVVTSVAATSVFTVVVTVPLAVVSKIEVSETGVSVSDASKRVCAAGMVILLTSDKKSEVL